MKVIFIFLSLLFLNETTSCIAAENANMEQMHQDHMQHLMLDGRTPLNLSPEMKQHQLANMRSHVKAVQSIIGLISVGDFEQASQVAYSKLGLTDEMKQMCGMFGNEKFEQLGLAFHKSGDELGKVLQTKDLAKSLQALHDTMGYCVQCHETFRQ